MRFLHVLNYAWDRMDEPWRFLGAMGITAVLSLGLSSPIRQPPYPRAWKSPGRVVNHR